MGEHRKNRSKPYLRILWGLIFGALGLAIQIGPGEANQRCLELIPQLMRTAPLSMRFFSVDLTQHPRQSPEQDFWVEHFFVESDSPFYRREVSRHLKGDEDVARLIQIQMREAVSRPIGSYDAFLHPEFLELIKRIESELVYDRQMLAFVQDTKGNFLGTLRLYSGHPRLFGVPDLPVERLVRARDPDHPLLEQLQGLRSQHPQLIEIGKYWIEPEGPGDVRQFVHKLLVNVWVMGLIEQLEKPEESLLLIHSGSAVHRRLFERRGFKPLAEFNESETVLVMSGDDFLRKFELP